MKTRILFILSFICISLASLAQSSNDQNSKVVDATIKVYGNCGMCKARIEHALDHKGIKKAKWDPKTKDLNVVYVPSKITEQQVHELIASVGHDTDKAKAKDDVYAKLPFCCLYRDHDHSGMIDGEHKDDHKKKKEGHDDHKDHQ